MSMTSNACLRLDPAILDRSGQGLIIPTILIGVRNRKLGQRPVNFITVAEVGAYGDPVAGPRMGTCSVQAHIFP